MTSMPPDFDFDDRVECAWTIPSRLYTDPVVLEVEKERIFYRTWQLAGHRGRLPDPGTYFTVEVAGGPLGRVKGGEACFRMMWLPFWWWISKPAF